MEQRWQRYGRSPVWLRTCLVRLVLLENALGQYGHLYGLSPVCVRSWCTRCCLVRQLTAQNWHLKGRSYECIRTWRPRRASSGNDSEQCWHVNALPTVTPPMQRSVCPGARPPTTGGKDEIARYVNMKNIGTRQQDENDQRH
uniref:Putative secreted protein n=1 Tax=Ixodes ricinus TaxID=34613 RepID=A0A6B0UTV4_IXORI